MLPGRDLTKLSLLGFAFSFIPGKPSWLTKPRAHGGAFSVAGLCKDAAGLSVPLGDAWSATCLWGLLAGKPTPPRSARLASRRSRVGRRSPRRSARQLLRGHPLLRSRIEDVLGCVL